MVQVAMSILQDLAISYDDWVHSHPHIFKPDGKAQITGWYDDNFNLVSIKDFGAFVNILPGIDGMLHISQISDKRVEKVTDVLKVGQEVKVRLDAIDEKGRLNLSMRRVEQ